MACKEEVLVFRVRLGDREDLTYAIDVEVQSLQGRELGRGDLEKASVCVQLAAGSLLIATEGICVHV